MINILGWTVISKGDLEKLKWQVRDGISSTNDYCVLAHNRLEEITQLKADEAAFQEYIYKLETKIKKLNTKIIKLKANQ